MRKPRQERGFWGTADEKKVDVIFQSQTYIRFAMAYYNLSNVDFFGDLKSSTEMVNGKRGFERMIKNEHEH